MRVRVCIASAALASAIVGAAFAATYNYDGQGRLQQVRSDDAKQTRYTLDAAGNRTTVASTAAPEDAPTAVNRSASVPASSPVQINALQGGSGSGRTVVGLGQPQFGTAVIESDLATVTYTPFATHPAAVDTFAFTVKRANGLTASAVINVTLQTSTVPN